MNYEKEFKQFIEEYEKSGFISQNLVKYPRLIVNESKVLDKQSIKGIEIKTKTRGNKLFAKINVAEGTKPKMPIHLCFGVIKERWVQDVNVQLIVGKNSDINIVSHCFFPNSKDVSHIMNGSFKIGKNSKLKYNEEHFHGKNGAKVYPHVKINVEEGGYYESTFATKQGVIGKLDIDYKINLDKKSTANVYTKVFGRKKDNILITEELNLIGENSKGLLKSRVATTKNAKCTVKSIMKGIGKNTRGHVDCTEIIEGNGKISAIPIIEVYNKTSHITHEASLGRVNKKQLETLMSKGLTESEATKIIIRGMLR